jgi:hypothetical protein
MDQNHQDADRLVTELNATMNKLLLSKFILVLSMTHALAFDPPQTPEQIQQQKNLAAQQVIENVPADFRTPLATFEKFYVGLVSGDASEFSAMTQKAIEGWLGEPVELTPEGLQRMRDGAAERDERDHFLGEFVFKADAERPEITFGYRYNFKGSEGDRITTVDRMRIVIIQTPQGWKIDEIEDDLAVE